MAARPGTGYLCFEELRAHGVPYGRQRIWELEREGSFPRRIRYGPHRNSPILWLAEEVDAWVLERVRARPVVVAEQPEKKSKRSHSKRRATA
jgi:predicted DNA-binding transcriptional regulator AlpA